MLSQNYKSRCPRNATVMKHSPPEAQKEGRREKEQIRTAQMPHIKPQTHIKRKTATEEPYWNGPSGGKFCNGIVRPIQVTTGISKDNSCKTKSRFAL